jgi:hypothetical protein
MDMNLLRQQIRQILVEEMGQLGTHERKVAAPACREETVRIQSDADLNGFAHRILEIGQDGKSRAEILGGRWIFRLDHSGAGPLTGGRVVSPQCVSGQTVTFEKGLITESMIAKMQQGSTLVVAKTVSLTPLARDEARRKHINIQRKPV